MMRTCLGRGSYYDIGNDNFRVSSVCINQLPPQCIGDPYSCTPRYVDGPYETCEATVSFRDSYTMYNMLKFLETYDRNTDCTQSIESLKQDYEEKIEHLFEKYNELLKEVESLRKKKYTRYKLKHKQKII